MTGPSLPRIRLIAYAVAATIVFAPHGAAAQRTPLHVYPALRSGAQTYVVRAGSDGRITECRPVDVTAPASVAEPACRTLTDKGVPDGVIPAKPASDPSTWVRFSDYPTSALAQGEEGVVEMLYEVDTTGRVRNCAAYRSSGSADLDNAACAAMIARARFRPARFQGQAVPAVGITRFTFSTR